MEYNTRNNIAQLTMVQVVLRNSWYVNGFVNCSHPNLSQSLIVYSKFLMNGKEHITFSSKIHGTILQTSCSYLPTKRGFMSQNII
jgi:hypothetical protein